jgi:hypothetical protein
MSLMDHLLDTFPLATTHGRIAATTGESAGLRGGSLRQLRRHLAFIGPAAGALLPENLPPPPRPDPSTGEDDRLWTFALTGDPASVARVDCRVPPADFAIHRVLDSVEFGLEKPVGTYRPAVGIGLVNGTNLELPLTNTFLFQEWLTFDGLLTADAHPLWPLTTKTDISVLRIFVYDLHPITLELRPLDDRVAVSPVEVLQLAALRAASLRLAPQLSGPFIDPDADPDLDIPFFGETFFLDDLLPGPGPQGLGGLIGDFVDLTVRPNRIVVACSLSLCKPRADFEPGGALVAGRIYPHIMVKSNIPVATLAATVRYRRPLRTTVIPVPGEPHDHDAHLEHHAEMEQEINTLLVADSNEGSFILREPAFDLSIPAPFWSNLFNYYQSEAFETLGDVPFRVVRSDRRGKRAAHGLVSRVPPTDSKLSTVPSDLGLEALASFGLGKAVDLNALTVVVKVDRQGEWDNLHLAPRMFLDKAKFVGENISLLSSSEPIDRQLLKADNIAMAPICAHDCLHTHWRWSDTGTPRNLFGWSSTLPYAIPGAPMVPETQDVHLWLRSNHEMTYHVEVRPIPGDAHIRPGEWSVIFHHGSAYSLDLSLLGGLAVGPGAAPIDLVTTPRFFETPVVPGFDGPEVTSAASFAVLYWKLRYEAFRDGNGWRLVERSTFHDLPGARDL